MPLKLYFELRRSGAIALKKTDFNKLLKIIWMKTGEYWHSKLRPKHFTPAGAIEYGYTPRTRTYMLRKAKGYRTGEKAGYPFLQMAGHQKPLVWSGRSRDLTETLRQRATWKGTTVSVYAPALNYRPRGGTINLAREMTQISSKEDKELTTFIHNELVRMFKGWQGVDVRRIDSATVIGTEWDTT